MKMVFLKLLQNSLEDTCAEISFMINIQFGTPQLYLKRDFNASVFL